MHDKHTFGQNRALWIFLTYPVPKDTGVLVRPTPSSALPVPKNYVSNMLEILVITSLNTQCLAAT